MRRKPFDICVLGSEDAASLREALSMFGGAFGEAATYTTHQPDAFIFTDSSAAMASLPWAPQTKRVGAACRFRPNQPTFLSDGAPG